MDAQQPKPDDQLAALEAEFPEQAPMLRQAMKDAPAVILRLQAQVDELEGALAEDDKLLRFAVDRGLLSQHVDDLIDDRDALKARVENLLAHNAEHRAQVDDLQAWNERLTVALTEIADKNDLDCTGGCAEYYGENRPPWCGACIARAALSAGVTESEA